MSDLFAFGAARRHAFAARPIAVAVRFGIMLPIHSMIPACFFELDRGPSTTKSSSPSCSENNSRGGYS